LPLNVDALGSHDILGNLSAEPMLLLPVEMDE
jgi:hypothetical protein